jgi:hypothetical protein
MTRRRRNPVLIDATQLLTLLAIGVGGYLAYQLFSGAKKTVSDIATGIATAAKNAGQAVVDTQQAAASALADLFPNNLVLPGSGGSFTVTQMDGTQITVPAGWKAGDPIPRDTTGDIDLSNAGNF